MFNTLPQPGTTLEDTMKLYHSFGMNPRLMRMFLLEKDINIEKVELDILAGENRQPAFLAKNPSGQSPALELDDGTVLAETQAIYEYLEEKFPNTPALIGTTAEERAETRMWLRRVEINICIPAIHAFYYGEGLDLFKSRVHCIPEAAAGLKEKTAKALAWLDGLLQPGKFLCGDRFTVADICLYTYLDQLSTAGQPLDPELKNVADWFARVNSRSSAEASVWPVQPMGMRG